MRITVRDLLRRPDLQLRLVADGDQSPLDAEVTWVASSDLADPTPFLDRGNVLLTTGRHLDPPSNPETHHAQRHADDAHAYIAGLRRRGVSAVGFGVRVLHSGTPPALVHACHAHGMPLFEVPYHVPFLAVIRAAADLIDAAGHRRSAWALTASRALSSAVLRPSPVDSILSELGRQLGRSVVLINSRGRITGLHGLTDSDPLLTVATIEAQRLLTTGKPAGAVVTLPREPQAQLPLHRDQPKHQAVTLTMQTVGSDADLRSVLVLIGPGALDPAEQTIVASAVALLWFAIASRTDQPALQPAFQHTLWQCIRLGSIDFARDTAQSVGIRLPEGLIRIAAWSPGAQDTVHRRLREIADDGYAVLFTTINGCVVACLEPEALTHLPPPEALQALGISEPVTMAELSSAEQRAIRAALRAQPGTIIMLDDPHTRGLSSLLQRSELTDLAQAILAPLDGPDATVLISALVAWLQANGHYEAAARTLGLHRHTLTARISRIAAILDRDLDDVDVRTELWLALRATGRVPID